MGACKFTGEVSDDGGGQYCWWKSGYGFSSAGGGWGFDSGWLEASPGTRCIFRWNKPSLSGDSAPGESGSGLGPLPLRSAKFGCGCGCGCDCGCDCLEFRRSLGRNTDGISGGFEAVDVAESGEVVLVRNEAGGGPLSG